MSALSKNNQLGIIQLIHNQDGDFSLPVPFEQEIFLLETFVAGTTHIKNSSEIELSLVEGDKLYFTREPENDYDEHAIRISTKEGKKMGYVPCSDNQIPSRLLDAGKMLFARVASKEYKGAWLSVGIKIYLQD